MSKDIYSLSHTRLNCKYHLVFAPKYRRKVFYGEKIGNRSHTQEVVQWERCKYNTKGIYSKTIKRRRISK